MASVTEYLDWIASQGWEWGDRDCLLWLATWAERVTGIDGGAEWRGRYRTAIGCARVMRKSGGFDACIERGAMAAGMVETDKPSPGSVGIVRAMTSRGVSDVGGIYTGTRWAVLTGRGVVSGPFEYRRVWSFV